MIHIGLETVNLDGKGFTVKVKQDQKVKQGDMLCEVNLDYLQSQNVRLDTMLVFPGLEENSIELTAFGKVSAGDTVVAKVK